MMKPLNAEALRPARGAGAEDRREPGDSAVFPASRLERLLGKSSDRWTVADLIRVAGEEGIRLVSLLHVGGDGSLKALDFAPRSREHLAAILQHGERADGSSLFEGLPSGASDILLRPRLSTAFLNPFAPFRSLAVLSTHLDREGRPLPESPDSILHRADQRVRDELGLDYLALGEVEYFLGCPADDADAERPSDRGYHATSPYVTGESLRRRALRHLADMGVPVKYAHSEVGLIDARKDQGRVWEQHEIELGLAPLPEAADAIVLTRWVLLNLAREEGLICRFDPIVKEGHAGCGLHIHSLLRDSAGSASGFEEDGSVEGAGRWLIGGLVRMAPALMAFGNRELGSFVRLTQAKETPVAITWGAYNRKALIRLPLMAPEAGPGEAWPPTIEFRLPDGSALPHLLLAGMAQALLLGRETPDLEALLTRTASDNGGTEAGGVTQLPRDRVGVGAALRRARPALEAGDVFPASMIEAQLKALE
jgi:glutamine synthetase